MKKLLSSVLILTLSLNQFGSMCSAEGEISQKQEGVMEEKSGSFVTELDKQNKSEKQYKKYSKKVNNNVDLTIPSVALSMAILGATGIHEYAKSREPNIFEQFYSATFGGMWNLAKSMFSSSWEWVIKNYPLAKDRASENYLILKSCLNSTYYDAKDWTSEKFDALKAWFNNPQ